MKFIIFTLLILSISCGWRQSAIDKKIDTLKKNNGWSGIIIQMAELHTEVGGPIDELLVAIEKVIEDLNSSLELAHTNYAIRTARHDDESSRLNQAILKAKTDQNDSQENLDNVLIPLAEHLSLRINEDEVLTTTTKSDLKKAEIDRTQANEEYQEKSKQLGDAVKTLDECISLLQQLGNGEMSLLELKNNSLFFEQVHQKLSKVGKVETDLAQALTQLAASQEFTDQQSLNKVINLIQQSRSSLLSSQNELVITEKQEKENYEQCVSDSKKVTYDAQNRITTNTRQLQQTKDNIQDTQEFQKRRAFEQSGYQSELDDENTAYDEYVTLYNTKVEQIQSEIDGCNEATQIVQNHNMQGYIEDRVNYQGGQGEVLKAHGQGVEVFKEYQELK